MSTEQITSSPLIDATRDDDVLENEFNEEELEEFEIDVVEDTPEEDRDRVPPRTTEEHEGELQDLSKNVQKRIKKLKFDYHEERRGKEAAFRMREEAVAFAQKVKEENDRLRDLVSKGEEVLIEEVKNRSEKQLESARMALKNAHEEGDSDSIVSAQEALSRAAYEAQKAQEYAPAARNIPAPTPDFNRPQADPRAVEWANKNPWFKTDKEMTAIALTAHEDLVSRGVDTRSDEYYNEIDKRVRQRFPEKFDDGAGAPTNEDTDLRPDGNRQTPSTVVAPARRTTGANPRKVQLTKTQVALAKRLGISPEGYAKQLLKLENQNG